MDAQQILNGLSREDLLQLIAMQQTELESRAQAQQRQREHAALELFQRQQQQRGLSGATAASTLLHDYDRALLGAAGAAGSINAALMHSRGTGSFPSRATSVIASDLLRQSDASAVATAATAGGRSLLAASDLELLQARARLNAVTSTAAASDPYSEAMRSIMLRKELLSSGGHSATDSFRNLETPATRSREHSMLQRLVAEAEQERAAISATDSHMMEMLFRTAGSAGTRKLTSTELLRAHSRGDLAARTVLQATSTTQPNMTAASSMTETHVKSDPVPTAAPAAAPAERGKGRGSKKTKRPLSAYNIYFKEEHAKIIAQQQKERAEKEARGEHISSEDEYEDDPDAPEGETRKRKRCLSTNQPGKRGKRQVDFENLTKVIGKRWKELPAEQVEAYKKRAEEAMQAYRKSLFQKIRKSVKDDHLIV